MKEGFHTFWRRKLKAGYRRPTQEELWEAAQQYNKKLVKSEMLFLRPSLRKMLKALPEEERERRVLNYYKAKKSCFGCLIKPKLYLINDYDQTRALEQESKAKINKILDELDRM